MKKLSAYLNLQTLTKRFGPTLALDGVSLALAQGEMVCLVGPSGCGKSTLLRVIAGLETPDAGRVVLDGRDLVAVPVHARGVGLMFQDYALFPHLNVHDNVAFGLRMQGLPIAAQRVRVAEVLDLVGLSGLAGRAVDALSGGERQRVALARSLAPRPRVLMLDEPLGALDRALRERLMTGLRDLLKAQGLTVLYVTHDQSEAFALADRMAVMDRGRLLQLDTPRAVYRRPRGEWVARFLGLTNILPALPRGPDAAETILGVLPVSGAPPEGAAAVLLRPEAARVVAPDTPGALLVRLTACSFRGRFQHLVVQSPAGVTLTFEVDGAADLPAPGSDLALALDSEAIVWLAPLSPSSS